MMSQLIEKFPLDLESFQRLLYVAVKSLGRRDIAMMQGWLGEHGKTHHDIVRSALLNVSHRYHISIDSSLVI